MTNKKKRIIHAPRFKVETLKLAEKVGVAVVARQLSLHESQLYARRKTAKQERQQNQSTRTSQTEQAVGRAVKRLSPTSRKIESRLL